MFNITRFQMNRLCGLFFILIVLMRFNSSDMQLTSFTQSLMLAVKEGLINANTNHSLHLTMKFVSFGRMGYQG